MAYVLYTPQMLHALKQAGHPQAKAFVHDYLALNARIAATLGELAACNVGADDDMEHDIFGDVGNVGAVFEPKLPGDPLPDVLQGFDTDSEWGES